jgi:tRNA(fMet)-specific endonuclease VapC
MAMILDTNALSAFAEGDDSLGAQLETSAQLYLPVVVLGEYRYGVRQSRH